MRAKKSLGQNFLINKIIIDKICNSFDIKSDDLILEIGPGQGALTKTLISKEVNYIGIELDKRMEPILNKYLNNNSMIIYEDVLKVDLINVIKNKSYSNLHIVGNLPYYITTPIIYKILQNNINFNTMTIMVQKEVGERILSKPNNKDYGYLSVLLNSYYNITKVTNVSKSSFIPKPKVDSMVIQFMPINKINYDKKYDDFLKTIFKQKRKTLKNNLGLEEFNKIEVLLQKNDFNNFVRAEELDIKFIKEIYILLQKT